MIRREDRETRHAKFTTIDPDNLHQPIGYGHLVDERGLTLKKVLPFRGYVDLPAQDGASYRSPPSPPGSWSADGDFAHRFHVDADRYPPRATDPAHRPAIHGFDFDAVFSALRARRG